MSTNILIIELISVLVLINVVEWRRVEISDLRIFVGIKISALVKSRANGGVVHQSVGYVMCRGSQHSCQWSWG